MILVLVLDFIVVAWLMSVAMRKGFDEVLPVAAFLILLFPNESQIRLPGLFDLTSQRVIVLAVLVLYVVRRKNDAPETAAAKVPLRYLLTVLVSWMLISSATSVVPTISFKSTLSQYLDFTLLYFIYAHRVSHLEIARRILTGCVGGLVVCCIFGLLEVYANWSITSVFPPLITRFSDLNGVDDRGVRMTSTFGNPILFGCALSMGIPMGFYLLSHARTNRDKVYLWGALLLMMLCIFKTDSRGPWLALLLSLMLLLLLGKGQLRRNVMAVLLLGALVICARPGVRATIVNLFGATFDPESAQGESYEWRYVLYHVATRELSADPTRGIWGYGPESFFYLGLTTDTLVDGEIHTVKVESCDSAVVALMMETGYVGLGLVALLLATAGFCSLRAYVTSKDIEHSLYLICFVNLCAFTFLMSNVQLWGWGQQSYMLWVVIAIAMSYKSLRPTESPRGTFEISRLTVEPDGRVRRGVGTAASLPLA